eukprot:10411038-Alexandrium_andersonii.AAC.1
MAALKELSDRSLRVLGRASDTMLGGACRCESALAVRAQRHSGRHGGQLGMTEANHTAEPEV